MKRSFLLVPILLGSLIVPLMLRPVMAAPAITSTPTLAGQVKSFKLPNGLEVILKENHAAPVVTWVVYYKVGSRNEAVGWTGSTHLLEHMMFKGTKSLGKGQIAQLLQRNGARFNASTWTDWTNYYETYSSDKLEMGIKLEADRMRNSLLSDSERTSEMTVVRNELERGESSPERTLYQAMTAHAYKAHPYHHPVIGWRSDVEGVSTERLRQFYDTYYRPNNAVAVLTGDFSTPDAVRLIEKHLGRIPAARTIPQVYTTEEPQEGQVRFALRRRGETNLVQAAWRIPSVQSKDLASLLVLEYVLGAGKTSRLYQALVEKRIATSAEADCGVQRDPSLFRLYLNLVPGVKHADAEKAAVAEISRLKDALIDPEELQKAKNQAEAAYVYQNDGTTGLALSLGQFAAISGRWQRAFELLDEIKRVTPAELNRVVKTYFQDDQMTVGWYEASANGPVKAPPPDSGKRKAIANNAPVKPLPLLDFEKKPVRPRALTAPVRRVLANGMTVVVLPNHTNPTVAIDGFIRTGGIQDPRGKEGLAELTASMLDEGTTQHEKLELAKRLEFVGAHLDFEGGAESTSISGSCLTRDLDSTLDVLAEELRGPAFSAVELERIKTSWISDIKQAEDRPDNRAARAFNHLVFSPEHPFYELEPTEQIGIIEKIQPEELRAFHSRHYGPNAVTLTIAGDVVPNQVFEKLERRFASWPAVTLEAPVIPDAAPQGPQRTVIPMMDKTSVSIVWGNAAALHRKDPDYYAAKLANYVLGGSALSSRLGSKLRDEMGLTYDVRSVLNPGLGANPWFATVTVNPANVGTAVEALQGEVQRFVRQGPTPSELQKAKSAFIGSQAVGLATNGGMASSLADIELYGLGLDYWGRYPQLIAQVKLADLNRVIKKIVRPQQANLAIAGPYRDK